jgi:tetratricopeptide (TPR) repeat protein
MSEADKINKLREERNFAAAEEALKQALKENQRNPTLLMQKAAIAYDQGRFAEAASVFADVLKVDPKNFDAYQWYRVAEVAKLRSEKRYGEAIARAKEYLEQGTPKEFGRDNDLKYLRRQLARVYVENEQYKEALLELRSFIDDEPDQATWKLTELNWLRLAKDFGGADKVWERLAPELKGRLDFRKEHAYCQIERQRFDLASEELSLLLEDEANSNDANLYYLKAYALRVLGVQAKFSEALDAIGRAIDIVSKQLEEKPSDGSKQQLGVFLNEQLMLCYLDGDNEEMGRLLGLLRSDYKIEEESKIVELFLSHSNKKPAQLVQSLTELFPGPGNREYILWHLNLWARRDNDLREFTTAFQVCAAGLSMDSENPDILTTRGCLYLARYERDRALRDISAANESEAKRVPVEKRRNINVLYGLSLCHMAYGRFKEAENVLQELLRRDRTANLLSALAWVLVWIGNEMRECRRSVLDRFRPNSGWSSNHTRESYFEKAKAHCDEALELDNNHRVAAECKSVLAAREGRMLEARDRLLAVAMKSGRKDGYGPLGALYVDMGRLDDAEKILRNAAKNDPDDIGVLLECGILYLRKSDLVQAAGFLSQAYKLKGFDELPALLYCEALIRSDRLEEAERVLRQAIQSIEQDKRSGCQGDFYKNRLARLHKCLADLLIQLGDERNDQEAYYNDALTQASMATTLDPPSAPCHFARGTALYKLRNAAEAKKAFEECKRLDPDHWAADRNARLLATQDKEASAVALLGKVAFGASLGLLVILWLIEFLHGMDTPNIGLTSLLLAMMLVSAILPWVSRLKLKSVEIDVHRETKAAEDIAKRRIEGDSAYFTRLGPMFAASVFTVRPGLPIQRRQDERQLQSQDKTALPVRRSEIQLSRPT